MLGVWSLDADEKYQNVNHNKVRQEWDFSNFTASK